MSLTAGWPQAYPWTRTTPRPSTPCGLHSIHQHTSDLQLGINRGYSSTLSICYIRNITLNPHSGITRYPQAHYHGPAKYLRNAICNIFHLRNICAIENLDIKANLTLFAKTKNHPRIWKNARTIIILSRICQGPKMNLSRICQGKNLRR